MAVPFAQRYGTYVNVVLNLMPAGQLTGHDV